MDENQKEDKSAVTSNSLSVNNKGTTCSVNNGSSSTSRGIDTAKKVPLQPGRSLMDWIRDAPKIRPRRELITEAELAQHADESSEGGCWLCVNGLVYDVTKYISYHPGGRSEIMRGTGIDATHLFNKYHPWVNIQSMLKTCIVGQFSSNTRMLLSPYTTNAFTALQPSSTESLDPKIASGTRTRSSSNSGKKRSSSGVEKMGGSFCQMPYFDWMQNDDDMRLFVTFNNQSSINSFYLRKQYISILNNYPSDQLFHVFIYLGHLYYYLGYKLTHKITQYYFKIKKGKNLEIVLEKESKRESWPNVGTVLEGNRKLSEVSQINFAKWKFPIELVSKREVTHDTFLFTFKPTNQGVTIHVPVGRHVDLYLTDSSYELPISRPYTAVPQSITPSSDNKCDDKDANDCTSIDESTTVSFLIKIYENGAFTSKLQSYLNNIGATNNDSCSNKLYMSLPCGNFDLQLVHEAVSLFLLAAGTGITPMLSLIHYCLFQHFLPNRTIKLIFFNKTQRDIILEKELTELSCCPEFSNSFSFINVLSSKEEDGVWQGEKGSVPSEEMLSKEILPYLDFECLTNNLICVCGPVQFTSKTLSALNQLKVPNECVYPFK